MSIYLDESGNLSHGNGKYFIVGSFTIGDPKRIANAFRKWQKSKFPRKLRNQTEIKFNDSHLKDKDRLNFLEYLSKQNVRIIYTYLNQKNIPHNKTGLLYTEIVVATLKLYLPVAETEFRVFRDQKTLKGVSQVDFNKILKTQISPHLPTKTLFQIEAVDSTSSPQIQIADWICGSLARYHENKPLGKEFYEILKANIVIGKELFSDYWAKKWQK